MKKWYEDYPPIMEHALWEEIQWVEQGSPAEGAPWSVPIPRWWENHAQPSLETFGTYHDCGAWYLKLEKDNG